MKSGRATGAERATTVALPLALAWAVLIAYASLFPFSAWRWPPGQPVAALLALPWPPWKDEFDLWSNLLGYLPFGLLLASALRASGHGRVASLVWAALASAALSYACEVVQHFLPNRHPSLKDWAMNVAGALVGALLVLVIDAVRAPRRWRQARDGWFVPRSAAAQALLALWPFALMFPAPLPLVLGQVFEPLRETMLDWVTGVPWAQPLAAWLSAGAPSSAHRSLGPVGEGLATALGLLAPCMLAFAICASAPRRVVLALGALAIGLLAMTLSTLLNFGPQHALAWMTPASLPALACGAAMAVALCRVPQRVAAGLGLAALAASVALAAQAPADPFFAASLQAWELGRFVRLHGLTQWIAGLWPYLTAIALLARLGRDD